MDISEIYAIAIETADKVNTMYNLLLKIATHLGVE